MFGWTWKYETLCIANNNFKMWILITFFFHIASDFIVSLGHPVPFREAPPRMQINQAGWESFELHAE